eukprot:403333856
MINVFFDSDLSNAQLDNPKIVALEQILAHLMMRTKNSQQVNPPWVALIDIFNQEQFHNFQNPTVKRHAIDRIFEFIFESYNRIPSDIDQQLLHVLLQCVENENVKFQVKAKIYLFLLHRMIKYLKAGEVDKLCQVIQPIFTEPLKLAFLQFSLYYLVNRISPQSIQPILSQSFVTSLAELTQKFRDTLKETQTIFEQYYEEVILRFTGSQLLFTPEDQLPILLVANMSSINKTRDLADLSIKSVFSAIDTKNDKVSEQIFSLLFNDLYFYKDFPDREDQDLQMLAPQLQSKLIEYLIKFECSASQHPLNQKLVFHCLFSAYQQSLEKIGLSFIVHMIKYNDLSKESTVNFLKQTLQKVLNDPNFTDDSRSMSIKLICDMGVKNYSAINDDIEIAINTFQKLKARITELENDGVLSIRNDFASLNYIEALNKLRDCYEQNLKDNNKRNILEQYVLSSLKNLLKEGFKSNSEMIYLLFLYLSKLDQGGLSSSVLLYSILLRDHQDIKIKKEAQYQLEKFNKEADTKKTRILREFLKDIESYLQRNQMNYLESGQDDKLQEFLTFNNVQIAPSFIEKLEELTQFTIRFYKNEYENKEDLMDLEDNQEVQEKLERLLLMNLNQNYTIIKSDFSNALNMIQDYLKIQQSSGALRTIGIEMIYKISIGTVNLAQRVASLKIVNKILRQIHQLQDRHFEEFIQKLKDSSSTQNKAVVQIQHEAKMNLLYNLTEILIFQNDTSDDKIEVQLFQELLENILFGANLSPNVIELTKFLVVCLKKLGSHKNLEETILKQERLEKVSQVLTGYIKRTELDLVFRKYIIINYAGIFKRSSSEFISKKSQELQSSMNQIDNVDIQDVVGKTLAKLNHYVSEENLIEYCEQLSQKVFQQAGEDLTLNLKRNCAIYLYQVIDLYGKQSKAIQDRFLSYQRVFMKFLFDRKSYMQDLSSKALSKIYNLGSKEARSLLVESLSKTFSGEKSASEHQEKDENAELLLEFKDNTSSEQKEKLKTYKDLCNIAVELGHRELIYQFLEVHRHLAHYEDIKNAAKGLSSIVLLDEKLKADLLRIAPKILLLSYDHNDGVKETMKDLWGSLIEVEKEEDVINQRWQEIFKEAFAGLSSKEYRRRQSSALALSDLLSKREWPQIKDKFKELFLTSLGLLDDDKDTVKLAAYQLVKTLKRVTMRLGNIYTNSNVEELEEILDIVIPMILNDCIRSNMKAVKFFSVDLLFELVKTTQNQNMMTKLKFQNKYEKQLVFNYNSEQKMKEIMNKYLDKITLVIIGNLSQMNESLEAINQFEQYALSYGMSTSSKVKNKIGVSEAEINDLRVKYTKESSWGEILKICRDQMTAQTFENILNELIQFMRAGHDNVTKSTAIVFVQDMILENKTHLITPQNSRKIAQKLVEIYSLNSVGAALSIKESLRLLYAQCIGIQMKILKEFPKTVQQIIDSILALPKELEYIICLNIYEISKNLPEEMLKQDSGKIFKQAVPMMFINRYKTQDYGIKTLSRKAYSFLQEHISQLTESNQEDIFVMIKEWFNSPQYDDRIAASLAMSDLVSKLSEDDVRNSATVNELMNELQVLIAGKYFNDKETVIDGYMALLKLNQRYLNNADYMNNYVDICLKQVEKYSESKLVYKNKIINSLSSTLALTQVIKPELKQAIFDQLFVELVNSLKKVSEKASMIDSIDEFEEKREEEKSTLQTAVFAYESLPLIIETETQTQNLLDVSLEFYQKTNWMIRQSILKAAIILLKKPNQIIQEVLIRFSESIIKIISNVGEKYETNLALISEVVLLFSEKNGQNISQTTKDQIVIILELIHSKGQENLKKNNDLIKRNINL